MSGQTETGILRNESGTAVAEYTLLLVLVAIVGVSGVFTLAVDLNEAFRALSTFFDRLF